MKINVDKNELIIDDNIYVLTSSYPLIINYIEDMDNSNFVVIKNNKTTMYNRFYPIVRNPSPYVFVSTTGKLLSSRKHKFYQWINSTKQEFFISDNIYTLANFESMKPIDYSEYSGGKEVRLSRKGIDNRSVAVKPKSYGGK